MFKISSEELYLRENLEKEYEIISEKVEFLISELKKYQELKTKVEDTLETVRHSSEPILIEGQGKKVEKLHFIKGTYLAEVKTSEKEERMRVTITNTGSYHESFYGKNDIFKIERTGNYYIKVSCRYNWEVKFTYQED